MYGRRWMKSLALASLLPTLWGCQGRKEYYFQGPRETAHFRQSALDIEYPTVDACTYETPLAVPPPRALEDPKPEDMWDLSLEECLRLALSNSQVMVNLGATVLAAPGALTTVNDPAIRESDPRVGVEAALAAFDAQYTASIFWQKNERPVNSAFMGFFAPVATSDVGQFRSELSKANAAGGTSALRYNVDYLWNNNPTNIFPSIWTNSLEAEVRQPLLQGSGVEFNRIAGPNSQPGLFFSNGVLLARINTDISQADFEAAVRNFVSDVENAYWDLYFAYRDLDAKTSGRDSALATWRKIESLAEVGARGGEADKEAQAREQYYRFRGLVENALAGSPGSSTISGGGTSGGLFRGAGGVYSRENNLRFLMNLPPTDGKLIRPVDEPPTSKVEFDWELSVAESIQRRVELRRQRWTIKSRELQLVASRNFLMPRLDAVALYRWYGLGDDYLHPNSSGGGLNNAVENLTQGDNQEWQLGFQFNMPVGFRAQMAGVRNAELQLNRERAILREQELRVLHDLSQAVRELERAYQLSQTNFNRAIAARQEVKAVQDAYDVGNATLDVLLDAQRRAAEAQIDYYRSLVEYNLAIKGVHFEKGTLLSFNGVYLSEGLWNPKAYRDAARQQRRLVPTDLNYCFSRPYQLGAGVYDQGLGSIPQDVQASSEGLKEPDLAPVPTPEVVPTPTPSPSDQPAAAEPTTAQTPPSSDAAKPAPAESAPEKAVVVKPAQPIRFRLGFSSPPEPAAIRPTNYVQPATPALED